MNANIKPTLLSSLHPKISVEIMLEILYNWGANCTVKLADFVGRTV